MPIRGIVFSLFILGSTSFHPCNAQPVDVYAEHAFDLIYMEFESDSTIELILELETLRNVRLDSVTLYLRPGTIIRYAYNLSTPFYQRLIETGDYLQIGNDIVYKIRVKGKLVMNSFVPKSMRIRPPATGIRRQVDLVRPNYIQQPSMDEIRRRLLQQP